MAPVVPAVITYVGMGQRVLDKERFHSRGHIELGVLLDFPQRPDHGVGVLCELDGASIGQIFACAG